MSLIPFVHVDVALAGGAAGDQVTLGERDRHHLATVLRLRPGAQVELADGAGTWAPAVLTDDGAVLGAAAVSRPRPSPALRVAQGLPKGRKLDEVIRVCTELGADTVVPVAAARSVTRLDGAKADKAVARWSAVASAASEQARRVWRPEVLHPRPAARLGPGPGEILLVAHPGGTPLPVVLDDLGRTTSVLVAIGPEGGWTPEEVDRWTEQGARTVGLGETVLRTEHAAAAALAVIAAGVGRWGP